MTWWCSKPRVANQLSCRLKHSLSISQFVWVHGKFHQDLEGRDSVDSRRFLSHRCPFPLLPLLQPAREIQVTVKQTEKETWRLWVDPYSPIRKMKAEIKRKNGTSGELRISFQDPQGERQLLSSQKTLSDYGIFSKVTIRVLETFPPEIQVFVKESSGQSKPYAIDPGATIYELKGKVEDAGGPCTENQVLMLGSKKLKDRCSLAELQIKDCDTIQLRVI